jgi:hypothetical protein
MGSVVSGLNTSTRYYPQHYYCLHFVLDPFGGYDKIYLLNMEIQRLCIILNCGQRRHFLLNQHWNTIFTSKNINIANIYNIK